MKFFSHGLLSQSVGATNFGYRYDKAPRLLPANLDSRLVPLMDSRRRETSRGAYRKNESDAILQHEALKLVAVQIERLWFGTVLSRTRCDPTPNKGLVLNE